VTWSSFLVWKESLGVGAGLLWEAHMALGEDAHARKPTSCEPVPDSDRAGAIGRSKQNRTRVKATSRILFPFSTVETGDFSGDSASAADSAGTSPPAPLLAFEGEGLGGSAVDL